MITFLLCIFVFTMYAQEEIDLTLIPPAFVTNKVDLDIRIGASNRKDKARKLELSLYLDNENKQSLLRDTVINLKPYGAQEIKYVMPTGDKTGKRQIILVAKEGKKEIRKKKNIEIINSSIRSSLLIGGAWTGIYHWSETEGKRWNNDLKQITDGQWKELIQAMHKVGMDIVVIQEVFRNEAYAGKNQITLSNYPGKAFYPSDLYPARMPIAAKDPVEAILSEADKLDMNVFVGVGLFAWFDFGKESLEWHKKVAQELWNKYGHHPSFYGFYVSEESGGSLDNWEKEEANRQARKNEIVNFFKEFKTFCNHLAPAKPIMFATNSFDISSGLDAYPALLKNLDILCPFGFARMPEKDMTGQQAANLLQGLCDKAGAHLWMDLEAFLFNNDQSLYPRPAKEIIHDLNLFDNFEKILCYQFPGVFNSPEMSVRIGEASTLNLYKDYQNYRTGLLNKTTVKPVKGTWLNLPYQDVRNKYMNPPHIDMTNPDFWEQKIKEYSEMGLQYLIVMAIANEQRAYYPSGFMEKIYPQGRKSPVEAIMDAADKYNMRVFMSCGWAINQDDDLRKPEIRAIQQRIMSEAAALFGHRKSFYGWYLPVEDSLEPYLSDHAVDAVNTLAAKARQLTPNAQIMISPYGICNADFNNKKFGEQIKKLKVDIIAYQDEVGCVREPMPMKRMKEHFKQLSDIHKDSNIHLWANVESFTWEKETNSRESALIPAAFPRYLSQITGVSQAGVEEVVSFAIFGIYDDPLSPMFIGQPVESAKAYKDYHDWQTGKGRWALLEATFKGEVNHAAIGKPVISLSHPDKKFYALTDGALGKEDCKDTCWLELNGMDVMVDLGVPTAIKTLAARFLQYRPDSVAMPEMVDFYLSDNGINYEKVKTVNMEIYPNDLHDCWIDIAYTDSIDRKARYVRVVAENKKDMKLFCDELFVNPEY